MKRRPAGRVWARELGVVLALAAGCAVVDAPKSRQGATLERAAGTTASPALSPTPTSVSSACAPAQSPSASARCLGTAGAPPKPSSRSVVGAPLKPCPSRHRAGFYRDGYCTTGADDHGVHVVCARVTDAFLAFSRSSGNDLVTPRGTFPGLEEGDGWCLCASRWQEAQEAGVAPPVVLEATDEAALRTLRIEDLARAQAR